MSQTDICFLPATELASLIRAKELSPVELVDAVLERTERLNQTLNAFLTVSDDLARQQAKASERRALRGELRGPIDGIPYSLKDLEPTAGVRTTFGSKWFEQNVPAEDGVVAARMKAAGGVLLGKTNTPQLGHKDSCANLLGPPCVNPWDVRRTSGGSSGGAGAAVAAGLGPLAHGTDGGGSIRIPAAFCGVVGLKPSHGRVPCYPTADFWGRVHSGPLTRTVRDAALMLTTIAGPDSRDPLSIDRPPEDYLTASEGDLKGLRVAWSSDLGYVSVDPEIKALASSAARLFAEFGCTVEEHDPGWQDPRPGHELTYEVTFAARFGERMDERPEWTEPSLKAIIDSGRLPSGVDLMKALLGRTVLYDHAHRFFESYDLLLTPQMPVVAPLIMPDQDDHPTPADGRRAMFDRIAFAFPFNLTGQPAISVPCGFTSVGLPAGLQIVGRWHADATVLRAAACFEAAQPWAQHHPALGALQPNI